MPSALSKLETIEESATSMWGFFLTGDLLSAERAAKQILTARPHHARALCIRSILAWKRGDSIAALRIGERAYESDPQDIDIVRVAARQCMDAGKIEAAVGYFERACEIEPGISTTMDLAYACLQSGDYTRGWDLYEARLPRTARALGLAGRKEPLWHGLPVDGPLLIVGEGGYGDMIQFSRFLPLVQERTPDVIFKVPRALGRLMRAIHPEVEIDDGPKDVFPRFKKWAPIMSLPHVFETTRETIPQSRKRTSMRGGYPRTLVGLAWGGSPLLSRDTQRSMPIEFVHRLIERHTDKQWVILQQGPPREAFGSVGDKPNVRMPDNVKDFADTAELIEGCDLVISVDTAVCHLAGTLGCPTWTLLAMMPEWRWPYGETTSPWYPSMRLFRQPKPGDWQAVVDAVSAELVSRETKDAEHADDAH